MISRKKLVTTNEEMLAASRDTAVQSIVVRGALSGLPSFRLAPGQKLAGESDQARLSFAAGSDGLQLSSDNEVTDMRLETSVDKRAIFNDANVDSLGRIRLASVATIGQVQILARDKVRSGHVDVDGLDIIAADARAQTDKPQGFGVYVTQGAFTLWNMQADEKVAISASLKGLSAGRPVAPVLGSGIFVSGAGFKGGRLVVPQLETGAVYSDGKIAPGTPDAITGGVFTVFSAFVDVVRNLGPVVTYGVNDMVLDNWGTVDRWIAQEKLTSYGPSGIGFVNFGVVNELKVSAPIETFGQGARGFNVYDGTVNAADFDRITTHADGAVGIQISQPIGSLVVRRGIETFGATGDSLVKGVVVKLSAIALSVKAGGSARKIEIDGGVVTHGEGIAPVELLGSVGTLCIRGGVKAAA
ncbi:hypothetical protein LSG25_09535 [Paralcaligenes sp. KSB-10]|uniref:hypothetical protein n=1 Tax=Paralcaligenes sp. KSB-10 TaxID=2901142 RepID=UPI001E2F2BBC|nr:hypothetical protein [Paralcaligenes sp. KSB-10]UHL66074.1 hypothetical protein LSG25_09535 [Paralcaligenes sp. KSB-10]